MNSELDAAKIEALKAYLVGQGRSVPEGSVERLSRSLKNQTVIANVLYAVSGLLLMVGFGLVLGWAFGLPVLNAVIAAFLLRWLIVGPDLWKSFFDKALTQAATNGAQRLINSCPRSPETFMQSKPGFKGDC